MEAEQHHEKAVTEWHRQELLLKGEITALSATKTRNLVYIKELDTKAVKQKEVLHDQVSMQECQVKKLLMQLLILTLTQSFILTLT